MEERILAELRRRKPARLLAVDSAAQALANHHCATHANCLLAGPADAADLAVAFLDENGNRTDAFALIGRLKQIAPIVLIAARDGLPLAFNDFLSFGMQQLTGAGGQEHTLYLFDLHNYKPAPDWLNSKYWANPERWKP